jgi:DNA invertase Pin-like site-specific DNA recombinase
MTKKTGVIYLRCSTQDQADRSPEQQRADVTKLAAKHGIEVLCEFLDVVGGDKTSKRREFKRMLAYVVAHKVDYILCWAGDRFARLDPIAYGAVVQPLRDAGIKLLTFTEGLIDWESDAGMLITAVKNIQSVGELKDKANRCSRGYRQKVERGERGGGISGFGYIDVGGQIKPHPTEFSIAQEMYERRDGGHTPTEIAKWLNVQGIPTRRGGKWTRQGVTNWLKKPINKGVLESKSKSKLSNHVWEVSVQPDIEAIVDVETWDRVTSLNERLCKRRERKNDWILAGRICCPACGSMMHGQMQNGKEAIYICSRYRADKSCDRYWCRENDIVQQLLIDIAWFFRQIKPEQLLASKAEAKRRHQASHSHDETCLSTLDAEIDTIRRNMVLASPDMLPEFEQIMREKKRQRERTLAKMPVRSFDAFYRKEVEKMELMWAQYTNLESLHDPFGIGGPDISAVRSRFLERHRVHVTPQIHRERVGSRYNTMLTGISISMALADVSQAVLSAPKALYLGEEWTLDAGPEMKILTEGSPEETD